MRKLTRPMIEALYVARVADHVSTGVTWVGGDGYVKSGTICALIERGLIMHSPRGAWELTRKGIFQLAVEKTISFEEAERMQIALNKRVDQAHAEALSDVEMKNIIDQIPADLAASRAEAQRSTPECADTVQVQFAAFAEATGGRRYASPLPEGLAPPLP